jgi:hypothetical protein
MYFINITGWFYSHLFVVGRLLAILGANWPGAAGAGDQRIFSLKQAEPIGGHHDLKNTNSYVI